MRIQNYEPVTVSLNKRTDSSSPVVVLRQGDLSGTIVKVTVMDEGNIVDLSGSLAWLEMTTPDDQLFKTTPVEVTAMDNFEVIIDESLAALSVGRYKNAYCRIKDPNTNAISSTSSFTVQVIAGSGADATSLQDYIEAQVEERMKTIPKGLDFSLSIEYGMNPNPQYYADLWVRPALLMARSNGSSDVLNRDYGHYLQETDFVWVVFNEYFGCDWTCAGQVVSPVKPFSGHTKTPYTSYLKLEPDETQLREFFDRILSYTNTDTPYNPMGDFSAWGASNVSYAYISTDNSALDGAVFYTPSGTLLDGLNDPMYMAEKPDYLYTFIQLNRGGEITPENLYWSNNLLTTSGTNPRVDLRIGQTEDNLPMDGSTPLSMEARIGSGMGIEEFYFNFITGIEYNPNSWGAGFGPFLSNGSEYLSVYDGFLSNSLDITKYGRLRMASSTVGYIFNLYSGNEVSTEIGFDFESQGYMLNANSVAPLIINMGYSG